MTDEVADVVSQLSEDWTASNTGGKTPSVQSILEQKEVVLTKAGGGFIFVYRGDQTEQARCIGYTHYSQEVEISFTVLTGVSYAQLIRMKDEAIRIVRANRLTLYDRAIWQVRRAIDVSDKRRGSYKFIIDTVLKRPLEAIP